MDKISVMFSDCIRNRLKDREKKIILFGSQARGNAHKGSDYDFLIIVDHYDKEIQDEVIDECSKIGDMTDELIGSIIWEESELEYRMQFPIGLNIQKEGVEI